jgi:predicted metal-dependent phosphoesterase TrpH
MLKIDLHTHSVASPDGGISAEQYAKSLESGLLDYIAITDHDRIDFALGLNKALGERIIVGEEISTIQGELVGLYLNTLVKPGQTAIATARAIKDQGGIVYVPHPFETVRIGIGREVLDSIAELVDIVEVHNGRAFAQNFSSKAAAWAKSNGKSGASSSDAHGFKGLGYSYSNVEEAPARDTLVKMLRMTHLAHRRAPLFTLLYPKLNRLKKLIGLHNA